MTDPTDVIAEHLPTVDVVMPRTLTKCACGEWFKGTHAEHIRDALRAAGYEFFRHITAEEEAENDATGW